MSILVALILSLAPMSPRIIAKQARATVTFKDGSVWVIEAKTLYLEGQ